MVKPASLRPSQSASGAVPGAYQKTSRRPSPLKSATSGWKVASTVTARALKWPSARPYQTRSAAAPGAYQKTSARWSPSKSATSAVSSVGTALGPAAPSTTGARRPGAPATATAPTPGPAPARHSTSASERPSASAADLARLAPTTSPSPRELLRRRIGDAHVESKQVCESEVLKRHYDQPILC